jgi:hypothetical protein
LFIRGINGKADFDGDGYVTGTELGQYLLKNVPYYETGQTPQYGKIRDVMLDEGNFVFVVPRKTITKTVTQREKRNWVKNKSMTVKGVDGLYTGEIENGIPHGQGTYTFPNGEKYVGKFHDGKRHGQGTFTYSYGEKYVGEFKDGKRHGHGIFTSPYGTKYVGEYKDDKRHGQGTFTLSTGEKYEGEFQDNKRHGHGIFTYPNGSKYVWEWQDGKPWNGTVYDKYGNVEATVSNGVWK